MRLHPIPSPSGPRRDRQSLVGFACFAWALTLGGCGAARADLLQTELRSVREELEELKRSQSAQRVQFDELRNRFVVMEDRADTRRMNQASREDNSWIPKLPTVKIERRPETREVVVESPRTREPPARAREPEVAQAEPAPPELPSGGGPADDLPPQDEPRPRADDPVLLYQTAKASYDRDDLAAARVLFEQLQRLHPKHDLADNALYWLGESYRRQALWLKAAQYYLRVAKDYPKDNKVPDALLQLGHCYRELGEDGSATEVWQQLVRKFPAEPAAKMATRRLAELKGTAS